MTKGNTQGDCFELLEQIRAVNRELAEKEDAVLRQEIQIGELEDRVKLLTKLLQQREDQLKKAEEINQQAAIEYQTRYLQKFDDYKAKAEKEQTAMRNEIRELQKSDRSSQLLAAISSFIGKDFVTVDDFLAFCKGSMHAIKINEGTQTQTPKMKARKTQVNLTEMEVEKQIQMTEETATARITKVREEANARISQLVAEASALRTQISQLKIEKTASDSNYQAEIEKCNAEISRLINDNTRLKSLHDSKFKEMSKETKNALRAEKIKAVKAGEQIRHLQSELEAANERIDFQATQIESMKSNDKEPQLRTPDPNLSKSIRELETLTQSQSEEIIAQAHQIQTLKRSLQIFQQTSTKYEDIIAKLEAVNRTLLQKAKQPNPPQVPDVFTVIQLAASSFNGFPNDLREQLNLLARQTLPGTKKAKQVFDAITHYIEQREKTFTSAQDKKKESIESLTRRILRLFPFVGDLSDASLKRIENSLENDQDRLKEHENNSKRLLDLLVLLDVNDIEGGIDSATKMLANTKQLQIKIRRMKRRNAEIIESYNNLVDEKEEMQSMLANTQQRIKTLENAAEEHEVDLNRHQESFDRQREELLLTIEDLQKRVSNQQVSIQTLNKEHTGVLGEIEHLRKQNETLKRKLRRVMTDRDNREPVVMVDESAQQKLRVEIGNLKATLLDKEAEIRVANKRLSEVEQSASQEIQREASLSNAKIRTAIAKAEAECKSRLSSAQREYQSSMFSLYDDISQRFSPFVDITRNLDKANFSDAMQKVAQRLEELSLEDQALRKILAVNPDQSLVDAVYDLVVKE